MLYHIGDYCQGTNSAWSPNDVTSDPASSWTNTYYKAVANCKNAANEYIDKPGVILTGKFPMLRFIPEQCDQMDKLFLQY